MIIPEIPTDHKKNVQDRLLPEIFNQILKEIACRLPAFLLILQILLWNQLDYCDMKKKEGFPRKGKPYFLAEAPAVK